MAKRWSPVEVNGNWLVLKQVETDEWYRGCGTPTDTNDLITAFKSTEYFNDLINANTIAIYVVGSRAIGLEKLTSDLDLIVIVDDPEIGVAGKFADTRLAYKGIAVHWKFYSYKELFYIDTSAEKLAVFRQQICYQQPVPIYLDNRGKKLNDYLIKNARYLTELGAKLTAFSYKAKLVLYKNTMLQKSDITKIMYHLAMASEILSGDIDIEFLLKIKHSSFFDYESLSNNGFIDRLTKEIHNLIEIADNIDYDELKTQTDAVNTDICNIINS